MTKRNYTKGFTLVELLVVIAIIAILAGALFLVINPANLLAKTRDSRRISELAELNKAIAASVASQTITGWPAATDTKSSCTTAVTTITGAGWVHGFTGTLSPFATRLPLDPTNATVGSVSYCYTATVYSNGTWELSAPLESADNAARMLNDGGNNNNSYEVGTDLLTTV